MGQRGDARRFLVVAVDHLPRRPARVGLPEHLVHRGQIVGPLRAVAIILGSRLPALPRTVEPVGQTYVLFRLRDVNDQLRSEEHTSELKSLMRTSYAIFCLKNKKYLLSQLY